MACIGWEANKGKRESRLWCVMPAKITFFWKRGTLRDWGAQSTQRWFHSLLCVQQHRAKTLYLLFGFILIYSSPRVTTCCVWVPALLFEVKLCSYTTSSSRVTSLLKGSKKKKTVYWHTTAMIYSLLNFLESLMICHHVPWTQMLFRETILTCTQDGTENWARWIALF